MAWRPTELCTAYGGSCDPFDLDEDYVRKGDEVRYVESFNDGLQLRFCWRPGDEREAPLVECSLDEWSAWAGGSLELVEWVPDETPRQDRAEPERTRDCEHVFESNPGIFDTSHPYCVKCGRAE